MHNGIIENYKTLKSWLNKRGHKFYSNTDTEVVAHLIEENYPTSRGTNTKDSEGKNNNLLIAVQKALALVEGTYGLAIISSLALDKLIVAKKGSPLVIGIVKKGKYIVASDQGLILSEGLRYLYNESLSEESAQ